MLRSIFGDEPRTRTRRDYLATRFSIMSLKLLFEENASAGTAARVEDFRPSMKMLAAPAPFEALARRTIARLGPDL
jgi:hypothetical protein